MPDDPPSFARSALMRKVRGRDTKPEMIVRRILHGAGYRYRLHACDLAGRPDIVFRPRRKAIFVHGCFWHRHEGCKRTTTPKTRREFWEEKFAANRKRDAAAVSFLERQGWAVAVVWECETEDTNRLLSRLTAFLDTNGAGTQRVGVGRGENGARAGLNDGAMATAAVGSGR